MSFLRHIIGLIIVLVFTALGVLAMPMAPTAAHQVDLFPHQQAVIAEQTNTHFAARAPPLASANVAISGAAVAEHGNGFVIHGHETHVASLGFGVGLDAPNRTVNADDVSFGRNPNQEHYTWRHVDDLGLDRNAVQNEILDNFPSNPVQGPNTMQVTVNGQNLQVNFYQFSDGTFNVGRINELP